MTYKCMHCGQPIFKAPDEDFWRHCHSGLGQLCVGAELDEYLPEPISREQEIAREICRYIERLENHHGQGNGSYGAGYEDGLRHARYKIHELFSVPDDIYHLPAEPIKS